MIMRSMETMSLRMHKSAENAAAVANFLRGHAKVDQVNYLGFLPPAIRATAFSSANAAAPDRRSGFRSRAARQRRFACSTHCR